MWFSEKTQQTLHYAFGFITIENSGSPYRLMHFKPKKIYLAQENYKQPLNLLLSNMANIQSIHWEMHNFFLNFNLFRLIVGEMFEFYGNILVLPHLCCVFNGRKRINKFGDFSSVFHHLVGTVD